MITDRSTRDQLHAEIRRLNLNIAANEGHFLKEVSELKTAHDSELRRQGEEFDRQGRQYLDQLGERDKEHTAAIIRLVEEHAAEIRGHKTYTMELGGKIEASKRRADTAEANNAALRNELHQIELTMAHTRGRLHQLVLQQPPVMAPRPASSEFLKPEENEMWVSAGDSRPRWFHR